MYCHKIWSTADPEITVKLLVTPWQAYAGIQRRRRYSSNPFANWN